jgi:deferrochelatase/peroxidase EfeB
MPQPDILGRNGTYIGLRKYQSRVGAFNRFLHANGRTEEERELLAAKLVGRWRSGAPLHWRLTSTTPPSVRTRSGTTTSTTPTIRVAGRCHSEATFRRMNPRDTELARLTDVNIHRIIRRGTTYGLPYDPEALSEGDDEVPRGAYFMFISAKAMATMEFLQQEWVNDGDFIKAGSERDPIVGLQGKEATFTIPQEPVRRRVRGIETFNVLRGGEYFFMPSLSALKWLGGLE